MNIYTPYTYLIGWSSTNTYYYGARYAKDAHPSDLWQSYFTSSKYVKDYREKHGDPDIIEVRKTFTTPQDALLWEERVLKKIHMSDYWDNWLNKNISGWIFCSEHSEATRKRISEARKGVKKSEKSRKKMSEAHVKNYDNPEYRKKMHDIKKSEEYRQKMSASIKAWHAKRKAASS